MDRYLVIPLESKYMINKDINNAASRGFELKFVTDGYAVMERSTKYESENTYQFGETPKIGLADTASAYYLFQNKADIVAASQMKYYLSKDMGLEKSELICTLDTVALADAVGLDRVYSDLRVLVKSDEEKYDLLLVTTRCIDSMTGTLDKFSEKYPDLMFYSEKLKYLMNKYYKLGVHRDATDVKFWEFMEEFLKIRNSVVTFVVMLMR